MDGKEGEIGKLRIIDPVANDGYTSSSDRGSEEVVSKRKLSVKEYREVSGGGSNGFGRT